jgi:hypothetical protein
MRSTATASNITGKNGFAARQRIQRGGNTPACEAAEVPAGKVTSGFKLRWDASPRMIICCSCATARSSFREIGLRLGRSALACQARYYGPLGARNGANHYPAWHPLARRVDRSSSGAGAGAAVAGCAGCAGAGDAAATVDRATSRLRDWTDLRARIAERGLTGGVFGDPPPGRSALDERLQGRQAPLQPSLAAGVRMGCELVLRTLAAGGAGCEKLADLIAELVRKAAECGELDVATYARSTGRILSDAELDALPEGQARPSGTSWCASSGFPAIWIDRLDKCDRDRDSLERLPADDGSSRIMLTGPR